MQTCYLGLVLLLCSSCGQKMESEHLANKDHKSEPRSSLEPSSESTPLNGELSNHLIKVPISLDSASQISIDEDDQLSLVAAASAYTISIEACKSGLTDMVDESQPTVDLYRGDYSCLAKLSQLTYQGSTYVPSLDDPFTTWQTGDTATFENSVAPADRIFMTVVSTLASPLQVGNSISYSFAASSQGSTQTGILTATLGAGADLLGGIQAAPRFTIYEMEFTGITASNEGEFELIFECDILMPSTDCNGVELANISYKLVEDTFSSTPNYAEAQIMTAAGMRSITLPGERLAPGGGGTTNGGFVTKSGATVLRGPESLVTKPNMILILKADGILDDSFRYFNIDIHLSVSN